MKITRKTFAALIACGLLFFCAVGLTVCELLSPVPKAAAEEPATPTVTIELAAVGDNLIHMPLINSGLDGGFDKFYANIAPYLDGMDIAAVNQETVFVAEGFSGYPTFGGPSAVGDALIGAGFNVIEQASNHSFDRGKTGLAYTTAYWSSKPVILLGVNKTPEEALKIDTFTKDGFTVALMNFTYGLNGFTLPSGEDYLVNVLSEEARPAIARLMAEAKAASDLLIVFPHWGTEYDTEPDDFQREWLAFFNENGADAIIGAHPHVLQPCETYVGESGKKTVVFYSLGNFISNQDGVEKELGGMARLTLVKDVFGARVSAYSLEPCFTHVSGGDYTVYMLKDYTDDLAARHSKYGGNLTTQRIWDKFYEITKKDS